jgi:lipopolysaccharide O-acetyltransferase
VVHFQDAKEMTEPSAEVISLQQTRGLRKALPALWLRVMAIFHYLRWAWRFAGFGWRSVLRSPDMLTNTRRIRIGRNVEIRKGARIEAVGPGKEEAILIGDGTSIHLYFHVGAARRVEIGRRVLIAGHVYVTDHDHGLGEPGAPRETKPALLAKPTRIDEDCWLGEGCKIMKGVHLGRGCIVGANAVVTRSFEPYSLLVGVPARAIRRYDGKAKAWVSVPHSPDA